MRSARRAGARRDDAAPEHLRAVLAVADRARGSVPAKELPRPPRPRASSRYARSGLDLRALHVCGRRPGSPGRPPPCGSRAAGTLSRSERRISADAVACRVSPIPMPMAARSSRTSRSVAVMGIGSAVSSLTAGRIGYALDSPAVAHDPCRHRSTTRRRRSSPCPPAKWCSATWRRSLGDSGSATSRRSLDLPPRRSPIRRRRVAARSLARLGRRDLRRGVRRRGSGRRPDDLQLQLLAGLRRARPARRRRVDGPRRHGAARSGGAARAARGADGARDDAILLLDAGWRVRIGAEAPSACTADRKTR